MCSTALLEKNNLVLLLSLNSFFSGHHRKKGSISLFLIGGSKELQRELVHSEVFASHDKLTTTGPENSYLSVT